MADVLRLIFDSQLENLKTKKERGPASTAVSHIELILCRGEGGTRNKYIHH